MKTILLWDPRFPDLAPTRLELDDAIASVAVRTGVAAPADPADASALLAGGPLDGSDAVEALIQHGPAGDRLARVMVPLLVLAEAAAVGKGTPVGLPINLPPIVTPTPTPTPTPAPVFTSQPYIAGTPTVGETLTGMDGTISGATSVTRRWLLGAAAISTAKTVLATTVGTLTYEVTATGPGGTTVATSAAVKVTAAGTTPTPRLFGPLGFNVAYEQLGYAGRGFPFLDRFKSSQWEDDNYHDNVPMNADRYPTAIPSGAGYIRCLVNTEGPLGPAGVPQKYVLRTNKLDMAFDLAYTESPTVDKTINGVRRVEFTTNNPFLDGAYRFEIHVSVLPTPFVAGQDYITVVRADQETALDSGEIFSPQFLARFGVVDVLRMMDLVPANHNFVSTWADRPKVSWGSWTGIRGVPLEIQIALCNKLGKHLYTNIPIQVDTDYVNHMAAVINDPTTGLRSDLLCGVEPGNENWNTLFPQYGYLGYLTPYPSRLEYDGQAEYAAHGEYPDYDRSYIYSGLKGARLLGAFMKAVGFSSRFLPIWATQTDNATVQHRNEQGITRAFSEWADPTSPYHDADLAARYRYIGQLYTGGLALTSYFHGGMANAGMSAADIATVISWAKDTTPQGIANGLRQLEFGDLLEAGNGHSLAGYAGVVAAGKAVAHRLQLPWIIYEGNIEIEVANADNHDGKGNLFGADAGVVQDYLTRLLISDGIQGLMKRKLQVTRAQGASMDDTLTDFGGLGDTYGTYYDAYGPPSKRALGMADFRADPGPYIPITMDPTVTGSMTLGRNPVQSFAFSGGLGRTYVEVTGLASGRVFDGFRSVSGIAQASAPAAKIKVWDDSGADPKVFDLPQTFGASTLVTGQYVRIVVQDNAQTNNKSEVIVADTIFFHSPDGTAVKATVSGSGAAGTPASNLREWQGDVWKAAPPADLRFTLDQAIAVDDVTWGGCGQYFRPGRWKMWVSSTPFASDGSGGTLVLDVVEVDETKWASDPRAFQTG